MLCPCFSNKNYSDCCGPFLAGSAQPTTPAALMRSRFTAFVLAETDYLIATSSCELKKSLVPEELQRFCQQASFVGLSIVNAPATLGDKGEVEFIASFILDGKLVKQTEKSAFLLENAQWRYHTGNVSLEEVKLERNQSCPCGSGKKFKQCHQD